MRLGVEMGAAKLSLGQLKGHDGHTAKKQHAGSVEAPINSDAHPTVGLQRGGNKCDTGAKTNIRLPKEGTTIETWNSHSLHACRKVQELTLELKHC